MTIALASIPEASLLARAVVLALVGAVITALVYGSVLLIVKADDVGLALAQNRKAGALARFGRAIGRGLVAGMPGFLKALAIAGTAAMIWVGGGIVVHGLEVFGFGAVAHAVHDVAEAAKRLAPLVPDAVGWSVGAVLNGAAGLALGFAIVILVGNVLVPAGRFLRG